MAQAEGKLRSVPSSREGRIRSLLRQLEVLHHARSTTRGSQGTDGVPKERTCSVTEVPGRIQSEPTKNKMAAAENVLLVGMLEMVAARKGLNGVEGEEWVEAVRAKLEDVEVHTLRDFMGTALTLNRTLAGCGHRQMHHTTLNMMLMEVCEMMFGPVDDGVE